MNSYKFISVHKTQNFLSSYYSTKSDISCKYFFENHISFVSTRLLYAILMIDMTKNLLRNCNVPKKGIMVD
jgi:hypothetical protein